MNPTSDNSKLKVIVDLYYKTLELDSKDISMLFGITSKSLIARKKNEARELMKEKNVKAWNHSSVNTVIAYDAWGIDIAEIEKRYRKSQVLCL